MLSLPFSNAAVERAFSQMALIKKNKLRNRMQEISLENIMRVGGVRAHTQRNNIHCHKFRPSARMLSLLTADIYSAQLAEVDEDNPLI